MKWVSSISEESSLEKAVQDCASRVAEELAPNVPDLLVAFVSSQHADSYEEVPELISGAIESKHVIGCSGGGVIGGGREVEHLPAFALTGAHLPGVELTLFHINDDDLPSLDDDPGAWEDVVKTTAQSKPHFVLLPDPFTIRADNLLLGLDYAFKNSVKIGGLASGAHNAGGNALFMENDSYRSGAVGVAMHGNLRVETVVAQGCRPIGHPMVITKCNQNVLLEMGSRVPLEILQEVYEQSSEGDRILINSALHVGVVMDPLKEDFRPGDFLIRNVMGLHRETGALVVGDLLREGQVIQFHVRDAMTAEEDLETLLDRYVSENSSGDISGAMLFSCLGRGQHLFGQPNHDSDIFFKRVPEVPLTGFFCNGEIGPVGGATFLHGFTSSFAVFKPAE